MLPCSDTSCYALQSHVDFEKEPCHRTSVTFSCAAAILNSSFFHELKPLAKNTCPAEIRNSFPPWPWALRHGKRHQIGKTGVAPNPGSMPKQVVETRDYLGLQTQQRFGATPSSGFPKKGYFYVLCPPPITRKRAAVGPF